MRSDGWMLRYLLNRNSPAGSWTGRDLAFWFDWVDDYISSNGNLGTGVAVKWTDWTWAYVQCYNTGFGMWTIAIDNRSVQTIKWRGSFDSFANTPFLFSYRNGTVWLSSVKLQANGTIQVEVQGTWSGRITWSSTLMVWTEYTIIVRVNNTLPTGTARVVGDVDIFVNWVKETLSFSATGNNTTTASQAYWWAYSTTLWMTGKMRSLNIRNIALSDWQCWTEWVSSTVVNTTWLINSYTPSNIWVNIGRAGYYMNVKWNVSVWSDGDGSYIQFNGNRTGWVWTKANVWPTFAPTYTQATSFSFKAKIKFSSLAAANTSGVFWADTDAAIYYDFTTNSLMWVLRWSTTVWVWALSTTTTGTAYDAYFVYDSAVAKFYCYLSTSGGSSVLQNTGGTAWPATFTTSNWYLWDDWVWAWTAESCNKYIYHAAIRNKALTQAEIDADIALWNTAKNDPSIVAYYIPDNLQYNTQYMLNSSDFSNASRTKTSTTVTANTTVAPDGTTTADTLTIWLWATSWVTQISTVVSGATVASKTFIVKAFVKVSAATSLFRLVMYQNGVATWTSANLTATTDRQEFTFTQTFTASTSATGITWWIINDSTWLIAPVIIAWKCRVYLANETLRDESPNIWWFIWWKHQKVLSFWIKPNIDSVNTADSQSAMRPPRFYCHMSQTTNQLNARYDNRLWSKVSIYNLWTWFRSKVHVSCVYYWTWSVRGTKIYINWFVQDSNTFTVDPPTSSYNTVLWSGRSWTTYFSWNIRDTRIYTFTWSFTDADALSIYNGGEPTSAGVTKYLHYTPPVGEVWTTTQDQSPNDRDWTLNGGVTRAII